ncbi:MAG: MarR family transcriptional regulator [Anaerolineales bacterium]|nr:MarR family transcriptional regulator [Anaerolineales bacterium]
MNRDELMLALQSAGRAHSTATIMFHSAIAGYFGLSPTDWKCGDIIHRKGPLTAGQLAELTGLTTGAVTGLIDRLEKAGIARRQPDPNDRRRVIIEPVPGWEEKITPLFDSMIEAFSEATDHYSDDELALILDFMQRAAAVMEQEAAKMRARPAEG